jgi:hypothetical protein
VNQLVNKIRKGPTLVDLLEIAVIVQGFGSQLCFCLQARKTPSVVDHLERAVEA